MATAAVTHQANCDGLNVQFELQYPIATDCAANGINHADKSNNNEFEIDVKRFQELYKQAEVEIDRLTNNSDLFDYSIASAAGLITGIIDAAWVGEFSMERASTWGAEKVNKFVVKMANKQGYEGDDLLGAVRHLEDSSPIAADKATNDFGGGLQHHLRDFSHHPTPVGLLFSLLTQFTKCVYGTDVRGVFQIVPLGKDGLALIGRNIPEKITLGVINWFFHMASDMAGSSGSIAKGKPGTGLPGPFVSLLKEISSLPIFRNVNEKGYKEFSVWVSKLFNGTLLAKRDEAGKIIEAVPFDLRAEIGVAHEIGRQSIPVIINECVVRAFYFVRRLGQEIKTKEIREFREIQRIDPQKILPYRNRTIVRMLTISMGVMETVDLVDAGVRGAIKSGGNIAVWAGYFVLRVNFVGLGRFAIAGSADILMEAKLGRLNLAMTHAEVAQTALMAKKMVEVGETQRKSRKAMLDELCAMPVKISRNTRGEHNG